MARPYLSPRYRANIFGQYFPATTTTSATQFGRVRLGHGDDLPVVLAVTLDPDFIARLKGPEVVTLPGDGAEGDVLFIYREVKFDNVNLQRGDAEDRRFQRVVRALDLPRFLADGLGECQRFLAHGAT